MRLDFKEQDPRLGKGLQRYDSNFLDSVDENYNLKIFHEEVLPIILPFTNSSDTLLDVGCGNGRIASSLSKYFYRIHAIDPYCEVNPSYIGKNTIYIKSFFGDFELSDRYNIILFYGSFYLMNNYTYEITFEKIRDLLSDNGKLIIYDDVRRKSREKVIGYYDLDSLIKYGNFTMLVDHVITNGMYRISILK